METGNKKQLEVNRFVKQRDQIERRERKSKRKKLWSKWMKNSKNKEGKKWKILKDKKKIFGRPMGIIYAAAAA